MLFYLTFSLHEFLESDFTCLDIIFISFKFFSSDYREKKLLKYLVVFF